MHLLRTWQFSYLLTENLNQCWQVVNLTSAQVMFQSVQFFSTALLCRLLELLYPLIELQLGNLRHTAVYRIAFECRRRSLPFIVSALAFRMHRIEWCSIHQIARVSVRKTPMLFHRPMESWPRCRALHFQFAECVFVQSVAQTACEFILQTINKHRMWCKTSIASCASNWHCSPNTFWK